MHPSVLANVNLRFCVRLLLFVQLATFCCSARGQLIIPPESLTVPSEFPVVVDPQFPSVSRGLTPEPDFVVTVRTQLISRFVNRESVRSDPVATQVMEASVTGTQTTTTNVQLRSQNNFDMARLEIVTTGAVSSNTIGLTSQARIATLGSHTFNITKPVFFDGRNYLTKQAYGSVNARQYPQAIDTVASGLPLIGRIGNRVAWNEVYRRMPTTDAIVARQVADDVLPQVNSAVDKNLVELNRNWGSLRKTLDSLSGTDRIKWSASSTSESFSTSASNHSVTNRVGRVEGLPSQLQGAEDLVVLMSQEGVNRALARLPLAGTTISDTTLQQLAAKFQQRDDSIDQLKNLLTQPDLLKQDPLLFSLKFAEVQPLALEYSNNWLTLQLKFQIVPKVGEPGIMQLVKIQLKGESTDDGAWAIVLNKLSAEPASGNAQPDLYTNMMNNPLIASQIPPTTLPRTIDLRKYHEKMPLFRLHRIQSQGGQFRLSVRAVESEDPTASVRRFP